VLVALTGVRLAKYAEHIARRTGLGQAITGAIFLGATTSLSGITTSTTAAWAGEAELAASNAVGGIAAQTVFLAIADMAYRKANLEHAAASDENMLQGALLIALLAIAMTGVMLPDYAILGVHPATPLLLLAYVFGQRLVFKAKGDDMWQPKVTEHTQDEDEDKEQKDDHKDEGSMALLWIKFASCGLAIGVLGYLLAKSGVALAEETGLNQTVVGALFTAVATSFPELITAIAAVRRGALTLAVSDIVGGNTFDVIFLAVSDIAFREGSLYHAMGDRPVFLINLTVLMTSVLLLGLIRREKHGLGNIGFESTLLLAIYGGGVVLLATAL
jgi:cation:H+ antiporter